jgi:hypothetical protein
MRQSKFLAFFVSASVALAGCKSPVVPLPYPEYELFTGFVTVIDLDRKPYPRILVEQQPHYLTHPFIDPLQHGRKTWFAIWPATVFEEERADGTVARVRFRDLKVGSRVRAWTGHNEIDTYPSQTTAARIRVVP